MKFRPKQRVVDVGFADPETEPSDGIASTPIGRTMPGFDDDGPLPHAVYIVEPDGVAWRLPMRLFLILFEPADDISKAWLKKYHERVNRLREERFAVVGPPPPGRGPGPRGIN